MPSPQHSNGLKNHKPGEYVSWRDSPESKFPFKKRYLVQLKNSPLTKRKREEGYESEGKSPLGKTIGVVSSEKKYGKMKKPKPDAYADDGDFVMEEEDVISRESKRRRISNTPIVRKSSRRGRGKKPKYVDDGIDLDHYDRMEVEIKYPPRRSGRRRKKVVIPNAIPEDEDFTIKSGGLIKFEQPAPEVKIEENITIKEEPVEEEQSIKQEEETKPEIKEESEETPEEIPEESKSSKQEDEEDEYKDEKEESTLNEENEQEEEGEEQEEQEEEEQPAEPMESKSDDEEEEQEQVEQEEEDDEEEGEDESDEEVIPTSRRQRYSRKRTPGAKKQSLSRAFQQIISQTSVSASPHTRTRRMAKVEETIFSGDEEKKGKKKRKIRRR